MRLDYSIAYFLGFNSPEEFALVCWLVFVALLINMDRLRAYIKGKRKRKKRA